MPKLSIILPVYNAEKHLGHAIDSVLNQTFNDFELICIDDGSTDGSLKVMESYGDKIRLIKPSHRGVAAARNLGIAAAKGEFITYLDADDSYVPDALSSQFKTYDESTTMGLKVVLGKSRVIFESDEARSTYYLELDDSDEATISLLGATLIPIAVVKATGNFNESLVRSSDSDWFMRLNDCNIKIIYNESVVLIVNRHHQNLTNFSNIKKSHLSLFRERIKAKKT